MINFDSIPANVQQFMIDKLCNDNMQSLAISISVCFLVVACIIMTVVLMVKHKRTVNNSIAWLCLDGFLLVFNVYNCCYKGFQINEYHSNPESAIIDYVEKARHDYNYYTEIYIRGIDIYGQNLG